MNAKPELVNLIHGRDLKEGESVVSLFYLAVENDKFTFWYDEKQTRQATAKLVASKELKAIDLTVGKGKPFLGIYKLDGDTLAICLGDNPGAGHGAGGQGRPDVDPLQAGQALKARRTKRCT